MAEKKLYIGLDVGSDSVGWAATDEDFKLRRIKGKTAWGARIFDKASDAKARRTKRTSRRRSARRKYRIFLLNQLFGEALTKKDPEFLIRLANSNLFVEDKIDTKSLTTVFPTREEEVAFYKAYPTIWHLRKDLLNPSSPAYDDIRLVYLAIHHIIKYRGNFLKNGNIEVNQFDDDIIDNLNVALNNVYQRLIGDEDGNENETIIFLGRDKKDELVRILENRETNVRIKKKEIAGLFTKVDVEGFGTYIDFIASLVTGGKFDIAKLDDSYESMTVQFDNSFEDSEAAIEGALGEDFALVLCAKQIADYIQLKDLLRGCSSLSEAFVQIYKAHKFQLRCLKDFCKKIDAKHGLKDKDSLYFKLFKDENQGENYAAFVHVDTNRDRPSVHDFNAFISKLLAPYAEEFKGDPNFGHCLWLAQNDQLLITIANSSTSIIPHQLHEKELEVIIDNAEKKYLFVKDIAGKVKSLFLFRVPYYYGPLNDRSEYSKVVRRSNETITPWNIDTVIDDNETRKKFISDLTSTCTYLLGETSILPSDSITYQKYIILNRLNGLRINGQLISQDVKSALYRFILGRKKTTTNQIKKYLERNFEVYGKDHVSITGLNEEDAFISDSYALFLQFFGVQNLTEEQEKQAEEMIRLFALYTDYPNDAIDYIDPNLLKLDKEKRAILKSKRFKGWGRLSKTLLLDMKTSDDLGVFHSILETLEEKVMTFNQIIFDKTLGFGDEIERRNREFAGEKTPDELTNEIINELPPDRRRSTIQAIRIVDEVARLAKQVPDYISIEVTREDSKDKRQKDSRYVELLSFLKMLQKDKDTFICEQAKHARATLEEEFKDDHRKLKLKGTALYLYFKQAGIDLYTGKPIDILDVLNSDKYDIDHIVPQSLIKDDSLDNKVLVEKTYNQKIKSSLYPIPEQIRCKAEIQNLWKILHRYKAISDKKYNNLIRANEITEAELNDFVNSQINIVNAANISIREILKIKYPNTTLIFSKAAYPSELRKQYVIPKLRELNDTHHAVDAYLNIVAGVTLYKEYSLDHILNRNVATDDKDKTYNMAKRMLSLLERRNQKQTVIDTCDRHDFLMTYRYSYNDSAFYDENISRRGGGEKLVPIHTSGALSDTKKYGGYSGFKGSYFVIANIHGKKERRQIVDIKTMWDKLYSKEEMLEEIKNRLNLKKDETVDIDFSKTINLGQKVYIDGCTYLMRNKNEDQLTLVPVSPVFLSKEETWFLSFVWKRLDELKGIKGEEYCFVMDKNEAHKIVVSKSKNAAILSSILALSRLPKWCSYTLVNKLTDEVSIEMFNELSLEQQLRYIITLIRRFTKNVSLSDKDPMRKTKAGFLELKPLAIYESVTGLICYKKEL